VNGTPVLDGQGENIPQQQSALTRKNKPAIPGPLAVFRTQDNYLKKTTDSTIFTPIFG
jgi:hypothetical protein